MECYTYVLDLIVFIFGAIIGSFLNVCVYRIPKNESIVFPPSHCMNCGNKLKWYDMFPVFSYIFLRGKCRFCKAHISLRYPLVESFTGFMFLLVYIKYGIGISMIKYVVLVVFCIIIGLIDADTMDVYDDTAYAFIICGLAFMFISCIFYNGSYSDALLGALVAGGAIALIILLTAGRGMGWGDFEIALAAGLFLGFKCSVLFLFVSFVTGGIYAIFLMLTRKKTGKDQMSFGPFLCMAAIICALCGNQLINIYLNML